MSEFAGCVFTDDTNNCFAACISMLTGIPFDELKVNWEAEKVYRDQDLNNRMNALLRERGWRIVKLWRAIPAGFAIGSGPSPRGKDIAHSVIVKDGEFFHDPHPSGLFVPELTQFEILVRILGEVSGE